MHAELSCCLSRINSSLSMPPVDNRVRLHIRADASHADTAQPRLHMSCLYDGQYWLKRLPLILEKEADNYVLGMPCAPLLVTADGSVTLAYGSQTLGTKGVEIGSQPFHLTVSIGGFSYNLEFSSDSPEGYVSKYHQCKEHAFQRLQLHAVCQRICQAMQSDPESGGGTQLGANLSLKDLLTASRELDDCLCSVDALSQVYLCSLKDLQLFDEPSVFDRQKSFCIVPLAAPLQAPSLHEARRRLQTARQNFRVDTVEQGLALASVLLNSQNDVTIFKRGISMLGKLRDYAVLAINSNKHSKKRNVVFSRMMFLLLRAVDNALQCYSSSISNKEVIPHMYHRRHQLFEYELSHLIDQRSNETLFVSRTVSENIRSHLQDLHHLILAAPGGNGRLGMSCTQIFMRGVFDCLAKNCRFPVMDGLCKPYVYRRKHLDLPAAPPVEDACELTREHFMIFCDIILFAHENYALSRPVFQLFCQHLSEPPASFDAARHDLLSCVLSPALHGLFNAAMGRAKPDFRVTCAFMESAHYVPTFDCRKQVKTTLDLMFPVPRNHTSAPTGIPTIKQTPKTSRTAKICHMLS